MKMFILCNFYYCHLCRKKAFSTKINCLIVYSFIIDLYSITSDIIEVIFTNYVN